MAPMGFEPTTPRYLLRELPICKQIVVRVWCSIQAELRSLICGPVLRMDFARFLKSELIQAELRGLYDSVLRMDFARFLKSELIQAELRSHNN